MSRLQYYCKNIKIGKGRASDSFRHTSNFVLKGEIGPTPWKKAIIIPIPKKSSKDINNFRGISLISIAAEVFNRAILHSFQARFRRGKS